MLSHARSQGTAHDPGDVVWVLDNAGGHILEAVNPARRSTGSPTRRSRSVTETESRMLRSLSAPPRRS
jgi:hypothetical protein